MEMLDNLARNQVIFDDLAVVALNQYVSNGNFSKVFVLVDEMTHEHCLPLFVDFSAFDPDLVMTIKAGEAHKTIDTCVQVWNTLSDYGADRKSLLINLGGGVVTDLGGFVASTFKRGIDFVNIPTTLLAMVDASVGGKTGVDLGTLKNQVGVINQPKMVLVLPAFLKTLEERQLRSGYAEMLKHALIANENLWTPLKTLYPNITGDSIKDSVVLKEKIVEMDPYEQKERKKLNFGHTIGHSIESFYLGHDGKTTLLHGEAIAIGMIMEAYLSYEIQGLSKVQLEDITRTILSFFPKVEIEEQEILPILDYLKHDKKNSHGNVNFTLLSGIGRSVVDIKIPPEYLIKAFTYYREA